MTINMSIFRRKGQYSDSISGVTDDKKINKRVRNHVITSNNGDSC